MELLRNNISRLIKSQLLTGSAVLFFGNLIVNAVSYFFHLLMGRMLGPAEYGLLASLISFTYLLNIPMMALGVVVVRYVSTWRGQNRLGQVRPFYFWIRSRITFFGVIAFCLLILATSWLTSFLHLTSNWQLWLMLLSSLIGIYITINNAMIQSFLRFFQLSLFGTIQIALKLVVAVALIWLGWQVMGPIWSYPISSLAAAGISTIFVYSLIKKHRSKKIDFDRRSIIVYGLPVFLSTLAFTSLFTTDVVLARHYLTAEESGFYAALANLGKVVYFAAYPIIMVMFPMVAERRARQGDYQRLYFFSLTMVLAICGLISVAYFLFPEMMTRLLYGDQYLRAAVGLGFFGIFISFYCLSLLIVNFYLAIKKTKIVIFPLAAALLQVILVNVFHQNLKQTVLMSVVTTSLLFFSLMGYNIIDLTRIKRKLP